MVTVLIIMNKPFPQELNELANKHRETVAARRIQREWRAHHKEVERRHVGDLLFGLPGFIPFTPAFLSSQLFFFNFTCMN